MSLIIVGQLPYGDYATIERRGFRSIRRGWKASSYIGRGPL